MYRIKDCRCILLYIRYYVNVYEAHVYMCVHKVVKCYEGAGVNTLICKDIVDAFSNCSKEAIKVCVIYI